MYKLQFDAREPVDATWFAALNDILADVREAFLMLEPSPAKLQAERQRFEANPESYRPDLTPDTVNLVHLEQVNQLLRKLLADIADEPNETVRDAYQFRIDEAILINEMVIAAVRQDAEVFMNLNRRLYAEPEAAIFAACCAWIRGEALAAVDTAEHRLQQYARDVLDCIPDLQGDPDILFPDDALFQSVRELHLKPGGYLERLFAPDGVPQVPYVEQVQGDAICRRVIANIGCDYAVGVSQDGIWAINNSTRQVVRPLGYRLEHNEFTGIICHEIGSHLLERTNGARQSLRLLAIGLDRYEAGNEGRAFLREQIMYDSPLINSRQPSWEYIVMKFLAICLASGAHGTSFTFGQVHEVLTKLHRFWRERRYPLASNNDLAVREETWHMTVRIMKGTDGKQEMGCYTKDIVYLQGNIACWRMAAVNPEIILFGDRGKFDIANPRHLQILRALDLLEV